MQKMAESGAEMNAQNSGRVWERNSTREAILAAARRVSEREGAEAMTLSRVAAEAGFAPPAVYAHFVSKNDLYLAVIADDLATLARTMRGGERETEGKGELVQPDCAAQEETANRAAVIALHPAETVAADDTPAPETAVMQERETDSGKTVLQPPLGKDQAVSLADIQQAIGVILASDANGFYEEDYSADTRDVPDAFPEEEIAAEMPEKPSAPCQRDSEANQQAARGERRAEPGPAGPKRAIPPFEPSAHAGPRKFANSDEMAAAIAQLEQTILRLEARPVDAWLERRLRVFERTLADVEARMEKAERDSSTALSTVSEGFKALEERFDVATKSVTLRGEESERRHRAVAADLRMYVKDLAGRLSAVETSLSRMLGEADDTLVAHARAHAALLPHVEDEEPMMLSHEDEAAVEETPRVRKGASESYLTVARQAAKDAATQAEHSRPRGVLDYLKLYTGPQKISLSRRTLRLVAGLLGLVVLLIAANIALKSHATVPAAPTAAPQVSLPSPDARVAALAKTGDPKAALIVAMKFLNGDGVATDVPTAVYWLKRAALKQEPLAEYWLGTLYERGRGVAKSATQAMQWYGAAAHAGNAKAMYRLGVAYTDGWDGEPDYGEAARWFTKAANFGVIDAEFNLAVLYERGEGVPQNLVDAFKWYAIAAAEGDAESKSRLDALATQIGSDDVAAAQKEASAFAAVSPDPAANAEPAVADVARLK